MQPLVCLFGNPQKDLVFGGIMPCFGAEKLGIE